MEERVRLDVVPVTLCGFFNLPAIQFPPGVLNGRATLTAYDTPSMFPLVKRHQDVSIGSKVVGAILEEKASLTENVTLTLRIGNSVSGSHLISVTKLMHILCKGKCYSYGL